MKWRLKRDIFALCMIAAICIMTIYFSSILPEIVPSHFNAEGTADRWAPKSTVLLLGLGVPVVLYLLLTFIPFIDPFWRRIQPKYDIFLLFRDMAMAFFVYFALVEYVSASEGRFQTSMFGAGFGILFIVLGNYLPKLPRNFFFGIRSPWTLASETVWKRTHILSGWLFVVAGVLITLLSFTSLPLHILLLVVLLPVVLYCGIIYPYFLYRKLQRDQGEKPLEL